MAAEKVQVVFMADTAMPHGAADSTSKYYRSLCLAAVRILLYLSQFPIKEHLNRVLWNFKLFNSERVEKSSKTWQFHENRSEFIEKFFQSLRESLEPLDVSDAQLRNTRRGNARCQNPVKLVYNALAAVVQDFVWDAPEIMSPVRPRRRGRMGGAKAAAVSSRSEEKNCDRNMVVILSCCPASEGELRRFCCGSEVSHNPITMATVREQLLPPALLTQLSTKGIAVYWVDTGEMNVELRNTATVPPGLSLMSEVLQRAGGTLIPLSILVSPLAPQLPIQNSSASPRSRPPSSSPEVVARAVSPPDSETHQLVDSVESELMRAPSIPKVRPSTFPSKEFLSNLLLPTATQLNEYLRPREEDGGGGCHGGSDERGTNRPAVAAQRDGNLLWFTTRNDNVLFILELQPACNLLAPNLCHIGAPATSSKSTGSDGGVSQRCGRERRLSFGSYRMPSKRLNFSTTSKRDSKATSPSDREKSMSNSHSIVNTPNPNSYSNEPQVPLVSPTAQSVVALGLVRQNDVPLTWLDPASVYSCSGLYVPRKVRNNLCPLPKKRDTRTCSSRLVHSRIIGDDSNKPSNHLMAVNSTATGCTETGQFSSTMADKTLDVSCENSSSTVPPHTPTTLSSLQFLALKKSPVLRLDKCLLSPNSCLRQSLGTNRRVKRSDSLPKEVTCSTEILSVVEGGSKTANGNEKNQKKTKSCHSLPSSPVILCNKLHVPLSASAQENGRSSSSSFSSSDQLLSAISCQSLLPEESLKKSGRYCSKQYINLCLWLAKNRLLLVVRLDTEGGSCLGVLQPVTSLVSTLTLLQPHHVHRLLKHLVNPLEGCETKAVSVPLKSSKKQLSKKPHRRKSPHSAEDTQVLKLATLEQRNNCSSRIALSGILPGKVLQVEGITTSGGGSYMYGKEVDESFREADLEKEGEDSFLTSFASDCELYTGLQLLFGRKSSKDASSDSIQSCLLSAMVDAPPFTHLPLLPWFPYTQCCGVTHQDIERLQELQLDVKDSEYGEVQRKSQLLSALRDLYSSGQVAAASVDRENSDPPNVHLDEQQINQPAQDEGDGGGDVLPNITSLVELNKWFLSCYEEQIKLCPDGDTLLRWSSRTLALFRTAFMHLLSSELTAKEVQSSLWEELQTSVLLSSVQLGEKYEQMLKAKVEEEGDREKVKEENGLHERKVTEHLLQILLHFETMKLCQDAAIDVKKTANTLVLLFRKLSLLANPGLVGSCLKKTILPVYLSSCQDILTEVYDRLMLPLPSDLTSSPDRPLSPEPSAEEGESSEGPTPLMSLEEPPAAPKLANLGAKRLARHMSFHDNQSHRQITVLNKKKKKRKRHKSKREKSEAVDLPRRSPRIANKAENDARKGRSVCRSLFSRSLSVSCDVSSKRKREREDESDAENQPMAKRKKGAHTLQRHHTVVNGASSNGLRRSPRKSFYSGSTLSRQKTTPLFKTPPLKENTSKVHRLMSPHVQLNKEPSPAAIFSLLHGQMVSPHSKEDNVAMTPCKSTKDVAKVVAAAALTISPRGRKPEIMTPDSKAQSRDLSFTPLAHHSSHSLAAPRDLSLMLSPGVLASYMVTNTPSSSVARSVERGGLSQLRVPVDSCSSQSEEVTVTEERGEGCKKPVFKSARMLTYETEDPLLKKKSQRHLCDSPLKTFAVHNLPSQRNHCLSPAVSNQPILPTSAKGPIISVERTLNLQNNFPLSNVACDQKSSTQASHECGVVLVTPPASQGFNQPSGVVSSGSSDGVCILMDMDPSIENESASMMAFALSTPTKDDPKDFLDAFN